MVKITHTKPMIIYEEIVYSVKIKINNKEVLVHYHIINKDDYNDYDYKIINEKELTDEEKELINDYILQNKIKWNLAR